MRRRRQERADAPGRFAYDGLDRALHERARLGIMTALAFHPAGLLFADLKRLCALTDGNLSRHLDVLRDAGLVEIWKGFENRRPHTLCRSWKGSSATRYRARRKNRTSPRWNHRPDFNQRCRGGS
jgi:DNA-binding transcriptional ArsR family regulator